MADGSELAVPDRDDENDDVIDDNRRHVRRALAEIVTSSTRSDPRDRPSVEGIAERLSGTLDRWAATRDVLLEVVRVLDDFASGPGGRELLSPVHTRRGGQTGYGWTELDGESGERRFRVSDSEICK